MAKLVFYDENDIRWEHEVADDRILHIRADGNWLKVTVKDRELPITCDSVKWN